MSNGQSTPPNPIAQSARATSVPALVTFWLLAIWTGTITGVFVLVFKAVVVSALLFGLISGVLGTQTTLLVAAVSFWVGSTVGAKAAGDSMAEGNKAAQAALATLAGAPPDRFAAGAVTQVKVTNPASDPVPVRPETQHE